MKYFNICILLGLSLFTFAQEPVGKSTSKTKVRNLVVGDLLPEILINNVMNDRKESFVSTEFKDQLFILDFWATTCSACIEGIPKMMDLQKRFGAKIKILPVTYEPETIVRAFLQRNKLLKDVKFPTVVQDKVLSKYFKHYILPHEVWVYKGTVIAITPAEYVDEYNIRKVLDNEVLELPIKDDYYVYDYKKAFLTSVNKTWSNDQYPLNYVAITGYHEGAETKTNLGADSSKNVNRIYLLNFPILKAYFTLWRNLKHIDYISSPASNNAGGISPNQVILEVKNKDKYIFNSAKDYWESWKRKNDISYEWVSSDTSLNIKGKSELIIRDLDRLLKLKGRWEKRTVSCLILIKSGTEDKIRSKGGERIFSYDKPLKQLHNQDLSNLVYYLNSFVQNPPIYDESGYKGNVDLDLKFNSWVDISSIRAALNAYGLDLKKDVRAVDFFVLTER